MIRTLDTKSFVVGLSGGIFLAYLASGTPLDFDGYGMKFSTHGKRQVALGRAIQANAAKEWADRALIDVGDGPD